MATEWSDITAELVGDEIYKVVVGNSQQAYATADSGVWYCSNILAGTPSWSCIKTLDAARNETEDASGRFMSMEITSAGTIYLAWNEWDYQLMGHWSGNAGGITFTRWSRYGTCNVLTIDVRLTWGIYPDAAGICLILLLIVGVAGAGIAAVVWPVVRPRLTSGGA